MKLLVVSDLHLEGGMSYAPPDVEYDAVVLAGDIHAPGRKAVFWAQRESTFAGRPVVLVVGNHELYGTEISTEIKEMKKAAEGSNVHVLDRDSVVIEGVRILGCTLWTDFQLPFHDKTGALAADVARALAAANRGMMDYQLIQVDAPASRMHRQRHFRRLLQAEDTLAKHWVDRDWLRRSLVEPFGGETIVVTHHAPSFASVPPQYVGDRLSPAFTSELPESMFQVPALWVHGHTHTSVDYMCGRTRVVSNPRGYRLSHGALENESFRSDFVVDLSSVDMP